jgi:hypothetical protein
MPVIFCGGGGGLGCLLTYASDFVTSNTLELRRSFFFSSSRGGGFTKSLSLLDDFKTDIVWRRFLFAGNDFFSNFLAAEFDVASVGIFSLVPNWAVLYNLRFFGTGFAFETTVEFGWKSLAESSVLSITFDVFVACGVVFFCDLKNKSIFC